MQWDTLLCDFRMPREGDEPRGSQPDPFRTPFEADYDRVVFSTAFRRLARKTQVHPMAGHDHVHNRLTHSIEVASVGRSFARRLGGLLVQRREIDAARVEDLCNIVQAACLVHDIGNPPFGHAGEFAIRQWVQSHQSLLLEGPEGKVPDGLVWDWLRFEGNSQGFRLACRADDIQTDYLRLTFATLGAMIKYPWDSADPRAESTGKHNVFSTERRQFELLAGQMGMIREDGSIARHPLSFLSEAADDICYRILDLEDAVAMGILDESRVRTLFLDLLQESDDDYSLSLYRGKVIRHLVDQCWQVFENAYDAIMSFQYAGPLKGDLDPRTIAFLQEVKTLDSTIYGNRYKVAVELGAYETLGRIINLLARAVARFSESRSFDRADFLTRRRMELAWGEAYARRNEHQPYAWWLRQVMDFVAGMTDNFARSLSAEIAGL